MNDAIKRADEVAAMGPCAALAKMRGDGCLAAEAWEDDYNALLAGYLATTAILKALGVNPAMAAYAIEQGWEPGTHCCNDGDECTSVSIWECGNVGGAMSKGGRSMTFTDRPAYYEYDRYCWDDDPPDADDEDAYPWGQFFVETKDGATGYPWDQRDAAIKHWKDGTDGR